MASVNFRKNTTSKRTQGTLLLVSLCILLATVVILLLYNSMEAEKTRQNVQPPVPQFDASRCLRLRDFGRVYAIIGDSGNSDIVWFCGAEGLRKLDISTVEWKRFGLENGLPSEEVTCAVFEQNRLLVGTGAGVAYLDNGADTFGTIAAANAGQSGRVLAIEALAPNDVYFSVENQGLVHLGPGDSVTALSVPGLDTGSSVTCLKKLKDGRLFLGMDGSVLAIYNPTEKSFQQCRFERPVSGTTQIWDILELPDAVFIGTSNDGIWTAKSLDDTLRQLASNPAKGAYSFAPDSDGFWCGTPFGLWRYHSSSDVWIQYVNPEERVSTDFQVYALYNTPRRIWYGTRELGAGYFDKEQGGWQRLRAGLSKPNVASIASSETEVYTSYGYQGNGFDRFGISDLGFLRNYGGSSGIDDGTVQALVFAAGILYYGSFTSFGWLNPATGGMRYFDRAAGLPAADIAAIVREPSGRLLLATISGVVEFDPQSQTFEVAIPGTELRRITALQPISDTLWYGTLSQGLFAIDRRSGTGLSHVLDTLGRVVSVDTATFGDTAALFVVSKEQGLFGVRRSDHSVWSITPPDTLVPGGFFESANNVMTARRIDGRVWVALRSNGCLVFDIRSRAWARLTAADGLVSGQVRSLAESKKYIFTGCYGGMNRIDKSYIDSVMVRKAAIKLN